ncbi:MAG: nucleotidyltransferase family protein [Acidimicrobiia bacterium]|nr:nucleotidyltransferase family protein [Acidimicrobiia bacterium]
MLVEPETPVWTAVPAGLWPEVLERAQVHGVLPLLSDALRRAAPLNTVPSTVVRAAVDAESHTARRSLMFQAACAELASACATRNLPLIALKGIHLASAVYPSPGLRPMGDIDVLVPRPRAREAWEIARALGYVPVASTALDRELGTAHHFTPLRRGGVDLEIHWQLLPPALGLCGPDGHDQLFARAEPFTIRTVQVLGLAPNDLLLHLCAHAAHVHLLETRLSSVWDLAAVFGWCDRRGVTVNAGELWTRAERWGVAPGLALMLDLAQRYTDVTVPAPIRTVLTRIDIPPAVREAAEAHLDRPADGTVISTHLTSLFDAAIPWRTRLRLARDRAWLTGWRRPFQLAASYRRRWRQLTPTQRQQLRTFASGRNTLAGWLNKRTADPPTPRLRRG